MSGPDAALEMNVLLKTWGLGGHDTVLSGLCFLGDPSLLLLGVLCLSSLPGNLGTFGSFPFDFEVKRFLSSIETASLYLNHRSDL